MVAYRDLLDGTVRLLSCGDLTCKERESYALTGQGWAHPWPTLTVDRTGRPLVVTYDLTARQLVLVACKDTGCERRTNVPLDRWDAGPGNTAVTVDRDNRPVVLRIDIGAADELFDRGHSDVLTCDRVRCGAP
ncbi:MAG: hypothetical protein GEV07_29650 [Streptosporangiales bacterium]|nr:hypothetical protein [Streptosporangiales bacterium]